MTNYLQIITFFCHFLLTVPYTYRLDNINPVVDLTVMYQNSIPPVNVNQHLTRRLSQQQFHSIKCITLKKVPDYASNTLYLYIALGELAKVDAANKDCEVNTSVPGYTLWINSLFLKNNFSFCLLILVVTLCYVNIGGHSVLCQYWWPLCVMSILVATLCCLFVIYRLYGCAHTYTLWVCH